MIYKLWYWPTIQGRGEFIRLPLEAAGIAYRDVAREDGVEALTGKMAAIGTRSPFAPPFISLDETVIAQTANILLFLGERHDLAPTRISDRLWLHQQQLTIMDMVAEAHDVHHPVGSGLYYDDQKDEAARAAEQFREQRIPKYLNHFEAALADHEGDWLIDGHLTYADCSLFQLVEGLSYAFPNRMRELTETWPRVAKLRDLVARSSGIKAYLRSDRRLPFSENGIFRHYPELDPE